MIGLAGALGHDPRKARDYPMHDLELMQIVAAELFGQQLEE